jgi:hypothetical protein
MSIAKVSKPKTPTGRVVQQAVGGITPRTAAGKIAVALGAEIGGLIGDRAHRVFVNAGSSLGSSETQAAAQTGDGRRRARRAWHTDQARREQEEAGRRAEEAYRRAQTDARRREEEAHRPTAEQEARTYRHGGKIVTNYYEVLEVSPRARQSVIEKAYRALMREDHPDRGGDARKAQLINEAYEVLRDPADRKKYDEENGF